VVSECQLFSLMTTM